MPVVWKVAAVPGWQPLLSVTGSLADIVDPAAVEILGEGGGPARRLSHQPGQANSAHRIPSSKSRAPGKTLCVSLFLIQPVLFYEDGPSHLEICYHEKVKTWGVGLHETVKTWPMKEPSVRIHPRYGVCVKRSRAVHGVTVLCCGFGLRWHSTLPPA
ncbi:hypothetical protein SKAU_G00045570 [Synaphobranchus kaupii]|uniref:Uncharacterized protein n=1 Tax=Synaphobranchus kaupii TaxID=118154 RepID=A0A9Q1G2Y3_SYNKA|nr:hypothetical protein SKAU_G00045570 [Synaphobranchus kaupii]